MNKYNLLSLVVLFSLLMVASVSSAQKSKTPKQNESTTQAPTTEVETKQLAIGDLAPEFKLKNVDGSIVTMAESAVTGAIVVFTCNHCPFSQAYESRIIDLHNKYAQRGYPVVAINSNDPVAFPEDGFAEMQKLATTKNYPFPYLIDTTQEIAKAYGATRTPQVFVISSNNGPVTVRYIGAIDDNADDIYAVTNRYVEDAVDALLDKREIAIPQTKAIGCTIKWKK